MREQQYEAPLCEIIVAEAQDILTASTGDTRWMDLPSGKSGDWNS